MARLAQLTGRRFRHLTVLDRATPGSWRCRCDCGRLTVVITESLTSGNTGSCGCRIGGVTHGATSHRRKSPEYTVWAAVVDRCENPRARVYPYYGGRGIRICARWRESFEAFLADMGTKPSPKHSLDRVDNAGNYEPGNCRWATQAEQSRNTRRTRVFEINGERLCMTDWCARAGIATSTVYKRLKRGLSIEAALGVHQ